MVIQRSLSPDSKSTMGFSHALLCALAMFIGTASADYPTPEMIARFANVTRLPNLRMLRRAAPAISPAHIKSQRTGKKMV